MFPILLRVLTIAGTCVVAGYLTRAYIQKRNAENELDGNGSNSEGESAKRIALRYNSSANDQMIEMSAKTESSKYNSGADAREAKETGSGSNLTAGEVPVNAAESVEKAKSQKKSEESGKAQSNSDAAGKKSNPSAEDLAYLARAQAKTEKLPSASKEQGKTVKSADLQTQASKPSSSEAKSTPQSAPPTASTASPASQAGISADERKQYSDQLTHKLEQLDALVKKSEPELDGPFCRPASLRTVMDSMERVGKIEGKRDQMEKSASAEQWKSVLAELDEMLSSLHSLWTQLMNDQQLGQRARAVLDSSGHVLSSYKQPEGLNVDLGLAQFSLDTAERMMSEYRYEDAFEKAGAVGMLVGMAEMRAAVEKQLKDLMSDGASPDKLSHVRSTLKEADEFLAEASKSFMADAVPGESEYLVQLQHAFQKTTEAQQALTKAQVT